MVHTVSVLCGWLMMAMVAVAVDPLYPVDLTALGMTLDSVGAQSTAGTARLLRDYPEPQRSDVLDLLFKPQFGASLQHLKVEIGGDAQISCGAEPTPIRGPNGSDTNFKRGYEHWLMTEAKRRNPSIELMGLVYAFPWWVNPAKPDSSNSPYASAATEASAAEYVSDWVTGMKTMLHHTATRIVASDRDWDPISSDYLGKSDIRSAVAAISKHYPHCNAASGTCNGGANAAAAHDVYGVPLWSSEDYSCWTDALGAGVWASELNGNVLGGNISMQSVWHLISAFYPTVAFWNEGVLSATEPWSGRYHDSATLWVTAHTTQFSTAGHSRYLKRGKGSGLLSGGGTYVSLVDPTTGDLSIVIETGSSVVSGFSGGNCNGRQSPVPVTGPQNASFVLTSQVGGPRLPTTMSVWRTLLGTNVTRPSRWFEFLDTLPVGADGTISLTLEADAVYSVSTVTSATHGVPSTAVPPSAAFPLPYIDEFEGYPPPQQPRYLTDMEGALETAVDPTNSSNQVIIQASPRQACCNFIPQLDAPLPFSLIGSSVWEHVSVSVAVSLPESHPQAFGAVGLRMQYPPNSFFRQAAPVGLLLALDASGWMVVSTVPALSRGLPWPCKPETGCLASGNVSIGAVWHTLTLSASGRTAVVNVDGLASVNVSLDATIATGSGYVALVSAFAPVLYDDLQIDRADAATAASQCNTPPAVGHLAVSLGCGVPGATDGSGFDLEGGDGGQGRIMLRSNHSLCLGVMPGTSEQRGGDTPSTMEGGVAKKAIDAEVSHWNATAGGHGGPITVSPDGIFAYWPKTMHYPGCDAVALVARNGGDRNAKLRTATSQWFHIVNSGADFIDIGWCTPDVDLSGTTWMGWQSGKAWVYRGSAGQFKVANSSKDQGNPYGPSFGHGDNVTAIQHSPTTLEFLLNSKSVGLINLSAEEAVPETAVFCVGVCDGAVIGLSAGVAPPPPPPPPPPPTPPPQQVGLVECADGDITQQWVYSAAAGKITSASTGLAITMGWSGDFAAVTLSAGGSGVWWSPDRGLLHGPSNHPIGCPCLGVCGVSQSTT